MSNVVDCPTFDKQRHRNVLRHFTDKKLGEMAALLSEGHTLDFYNFGPKIAFRKEHLNLVNLEIKERENV